MGKPFAPRSPRPSIREPGWGEHMSKYPTPARLTVRDDGDATVVDVGPRGKHVSNVTLVFNRDIQTLWSTPNVGVIDTRFADLAGKWLESCHTTTTMTQLTVGVYNMGITSWERGCQTGVGVHRLCAPACFGVKYHRTSSSHDL